MLPIERKQPHPSTLLPPRITRAAAKRAATADETSEPSPKKTKVTKQKQKKKKKKKEEEEVKDDNASSKTTIIVEHCKQCKSFKTRAIQVKEGLEKSVSGVTVILNPKNPRRGCFEIREEEEGGKKFISLLNMKRPFTAMKNLDMEKVISNIVDEISKTGG
ncbi:hypothetical protein Lal_00044667 [Lupinus albus]|uniref:Uncharacterized protein n=1 Tax=Lupinus albus TaxID=3870 RepID=A0A6A5L808_LUPAL|nr:hypothetical protein Lalb_Chr24g0402441 [Lupinus albus]KAF1858634.1 hypothetical protein Lal_00044667 [Lupinus albus]